MTYTKNNPFEFTAVLRGQPVTVEGDEGDWIEVEKVALGDGTALELTDEEHDYISDMAHEYCEEYR